MKKEEKKITVECRSCGVNASASSVDELIEQGWDFQNQLCGLHNYNNAGEEEEEEEEFEEDENLSHETIEKLTSIQLRGLPL